MKIIEVRQSNGAVSYKVKGYLGMDGDTGRVVNTTRSGFASAQEAMDAWRKLRQEFKDNKSKLIETPKMPRFKDIYAEYIKWYEPQVEASTFTKTQEIYRNHILPVFGEYFVDRITVRDVQSFADELCKKFVTGKKICNYASKVLEEAKRLDYVQENVFDRVRYPLHPIKAAHSVTQNYYTKNELELFLNALDKNVADSKTTQSNYLNALRTRAFLRLLAMTGLRRGEALALKDDGFNFDRNIVSVKSAIKYAKRAYEGTTKSKSGLRIVQVDPITLKYIHDYFSFRDQYFLSLGYNLKNMEHYAFLNNQKPTLIAQSEPRKMMLTICNKYQLRRITVHGLRHTQATLLYAAGAKDIDVATRLGHSDANITRQVYVHESEDIANQAFGILNSYLSAK